MYRGGVTGLVGGVFAGHLTRPTSTYTPEILKVSSNKPYTPKLSTIMGNAKTPNIRQNPVGEKDLLTTKADSILNKVNKPIN